MKKLLICFSAFFSFTFSLWAFDISGTLHVDNYGANPSVGFSFLAEERVMEAIKIKAQAEYLTAKNYDVQTLVIGNISKLILGGGVALAITDSTEIPIIPGIEGIFGFQITDNFRIETSAIVAFTPSDITEMHNIRAKLDFLYKSKNIDSSISHTLKKRININEVLNTFNIKLEAFAPNFPVGLLVGSKIDFLTTETIRGLDLDVTGGLSFFTKKYGTYLAKVQVKVLSHKENGGIPFDISVGARFNL